jgi:hypothetical protein
VAFAKIITFTALGTCWTFTSFPILPRERAPDGSNGTWKTFENKAEFILKGGTR